jgi:hypothetical protein
MFVLPLMYVTIDVRASPAANRFGQNYIYIVKNIVLAFPAATTKNIVD